VWHLCLSSDQKTDPTVLVAAALGYIVKKTAIQQDPWFRRSSDQKTDPTVLVAAALGYIVKRTAIQQDPWFRR
jgi:hypothetical protein